MNYSAPTIYSAPEVADVTSVRDLIDRMAGTQPDLAFLISPETGRVLTFKGLQDQARHLFGRFRQMGLEHGDKIAFLMDNGLFTAQLFLGAMYGGFVSVPLNVRAGLSQLSYMLDHCDAKVVFVGSKYDTLIKEAMAHVRRPIKVISADIDSCPEVIETSSTTDALPPLRAEDAAMLMYSSGTHRDNRMERSIPTGPFLLTEGIPLVRTSSPPRIGLFLFFPCIT